MCHGEGGAGVADGDGHEFHLSPYWFGSDDEGGIFGGLLLKPLVAFKVLEESDLDEDEVAFLAVESARVRRRDVRYSFGVDELEGGAVSLPETGLPGLVGEYLSRDAGRDLRAFRVSSRWVLVVYRVLGDIRVSAVSRFFFRWEWCEPTRRGLVWTLFGPLVFV